MAKPKPAIRVRKPPRADTDPVTVERFISGASEVETPKHLNVQTSEHEGIQGQERSDAQAPERSNARTPERPDVQESGRLDAQGLKSSRGIVHRQDGRQRRRMTVYLSPMVAQQLAIYCATQGKEFSNTVEEAVSRFLSVHPTPI